MISCEIDWLWGFKMRRSRDGCCQRERERDLKFQKAYEVTQAMELAAKNAQQLSASASVDRYQA